MYIISSSTVLIIIISCIILVTHCENVINSEDGLKSAETELSNYMQKIEDKQSIPIVGDFVVLQKNEEALKGATERNEDIIERCARFLAGRELRIKLPNSEARDLVSEARRKKIKRVGRVILPILLLLKLKAAIILPIILSVIALVSFKGFGLSLAALAVAGTTALKNLLEHVGSKVSYEVVPTPVGHWSRSGLLDSLSSYQYDL